MYLIDMHSHLLPGLDDGAESVETSINMMRESYRQGIEVIVATPHCRIREKEDIDIFLKRREESYNLLLKTVKETAEPLPEVVLGCELQLEDCILKCDDLQRLCIGGTDYILVEMPYRKWTSDLIDVVYDLTLRNLKPIMAHIERFFENENFYENLLELDLLYQVNGETMTNPGSDRILKYLFRNGMIHLIGSDMHNMDVRPQILADAYKKIRKLYGAECEKYFKENARRVLENMPVTGQEFKRRNIFKRIVEKK